MTQEATVTIPASEYRELKAAAEWLRCLEEAGVDNWEGVPWALIIKEQRSKEEEQG